MRRLIEAMSAAFSGSQPWRGGVVASLCVAVCAVLCDACASTAPAISRGTMPMNKHRVTAR